jgi:uncharacterized protein DUF559
MTRGDGHDLGLAELLSSQDRVLSVGAAMKYLTRDALRWRVSSGRWQQPCRGIVVAHSGPLTEIQELRIAVLWAGPGAVLAGLTAARLDGLSGFSDRGERPIHLLVPASSPVWRARPGLPLVDAAAWMGSDRGTQAVLAAGVQQRLARPCDLLAVVAGNPRLPRRDSAGRRRWLDAVWETARLIVEVDGIHHIDAAQYWADMDRGNDFTLGGYRILRFPAFVVRYRSGYVAGKIREALRGDGRRIEIPA